MCVMEKACAGVARFAFWLIFEAHFVKHTCCTNIICLKLTGVQNANPLF